MQKAVEKYIYYLSEDKYRIKFLRTDKNNNKTIKVDETIIGKSEDAINER